MRQISFIVLFATLISGCMTMRPVSQEADIAEIVKVGRQVELITKSGNVFNLTVTRVTQADIAGTSASGRNITINIVDIEAINAEMIDGAKTTLAVVGGVVAVPAIVATELVAVIIWCRIIC